MLCCNFGMQLSWFQDSTDMKLASHGDTVIREVYLDILGPGVKLESFAPHAFAPKCANGRAKSRSRLFRNGICQNLDCQNIY